MLVKQVIKKIMVPFSEWFKSTIKYTTQKILRLVINEYLNIKLKRTQ